MPATTPTTTPPAEAASTSKTSQVNIEQGLTLCPRFDAQGLVAAIVTDAVTGDVLMFAWMNSEALRLTIDTGIAHFWSRSRAKIWKKGEESGNLLEIAELRVDCDQDALWLKVRIKGAGVACHTGERSCFYRSVPVGEPGSTRLKRG
jgi:phosphoribosyl-AMP cyclohydrolase